MRPQTKNVRWAEGDRKNSVDGAIFAGNYGRAGSIDMDSPMYSQRDLLLAIDRAIAFGDAQGNLSGRIGWLFAGAIGATTWWLLLTWLW
jgi:hypothetical protein